MTLSAFHSTLFIHFNFDKGDGYVAQYCKTQSVSRLVSLQFIKFANPSPCWGGFALLKTARALTWATPTGDDAFASNIAGDQTRAGGHSGPHIARRLPWESLETNAPLGELTPLAEPADLLRIRHPVLSAF